MKRKVLTLALGLSMLFGLMVNASAASTVNSPSRPTTPDTGWVDPAPVEPGKTEDPAPVVNPDGVKVTAVQDASSLPAEEAAVLTAATEAITSAESTAAFLETVGITSAVEKALADTKVAAADLAPAATFSVSASGEAAKVLAETGSVTLSFDVAGIADGAAVVVLVFDGTNWTVVPATVKDGKVVGTFTTLGTVVIMTADEAAASSRVTSPQTSGANFESVILACGVVVSLAVLALCIKRSRMA